MRPICSWLEGLSRASICIAVVGVMTGFAADELEESIVVDPSDVGENELLLPGRDQRRDVFYSITETLAAEAERAALQAEAEETGSSTQSGVTAAAAADPSNERDAERFATEATAEVEAHLRNRAWDRGMQTAQRRLRQIRVYRDAFPQNAIIAEGETSLEQLYVLAEDRKLQEEAKEQFDALGLMIEGVMWSAEGESLVIINGEPVARRVDDQVRGATIKVIDRNRVDFIYPYRQRRYHFQLYLEAKE